MAQARWNFRLGPLQFTSKLGLISVLLLVGIVLCCCGAGVVGAFTDADPPPAAPVVETTAPPAEEPAEPSSAATQVGRTVSPGAFCDTAGATGVTEAGSPMVCKGTDDLRWRRR